METDINDFNGKMKVIKSEIRYTMITSNFGSMKENDVINPEKI